MRLSFVPHGYHCCCLLSLFHILTYQYPHTTLTHSWTAFHEGGIAHLNIVVAWSIVQSSGCDIGSFLGVDVSQQRQQPLPLAQLGSHYHSQLLWISSLMVVHSSRIKWIWCWLACCYRYCSYSLDVTNLDVLLDFSKWCFMDWMNAFEYYLLQQQRFSDYEMKLTTLWTYMGVRITSRGETAE